MPARLRNKYGSQRSGSQGERGCSQVSLRILTTVTARQGHSLGYPARRTINTQDGGHFERGDRTRSTTSRSRAKSHTPSEGTPARRVQEHELESDSEDAAPTDRSRRSPRRVREYELESDSEDAAPTNRSRRRSPPISGCAGRSVCSWPQALLIISDTTSDNPLTLARYWQQPKQ